MDEAGVDRVVMVPPSWPGDRNDYGLEAAQRYPQRFAVMGRIPLEKPESAAGLPKWKEQPGMLGIRLTFLGPQAAWLTAGTANWIWPAAEKAGLPIMFLAPGRSATFAPIAERHRRGQGLGDGTRDPGAAEVGLRGRQGRRVGDNRLYSVVFELSERATEEPTKQSPRRRMCDEAPAAGSGRTEFSSSCD
jgi:hypothetical protein